MTREERSKRTGDLINWLDAQGWSPEDAHTILTAVAMSIALVHGDDEEEE